jgi:hypothetical protein
LNSSSICNSLVGVDALASSLPLKKYGVVFYEVGKFDGDEDLMKNDEDDEGVLHFS